MTLQLDAGLVPAPPHSRRTVAILTLGCKLNIAESDAIARDLRAAGCDVVDRPAVVDAYVINSCAVTHTADSKTRHLVRLARRLSPDATIVLTGCFPETVAPEAPLALGADLVVPSREKAGVARRLFAAWAPDQSGRTGEGLPLASGLTASAPHPPPGSHTRAFIKAQEGCNDVCAFCIVPRTRGRERSVDPAAVVATVRQREAEGALEVVITGTQLGVWGRDRDRSAYGPATLIRALLAETAVPRIRFSSLQPQDITPELLALWEDLRLCRHFHLALQSGSDRVLARMRRRYTTADYRRALAAIRAAIPDVAVTTDVIAGFPGETEDEHEESLAFCREAAFAQTHVFPYSRRRGTGADLLPEHVPTETKRERVAAMAAVARASSVASRRAYLGRTLPVLWERTPSIHDGVKEWDGLTDNYIRVITTSEADLGNTLLPARLVEETAEGVRGELLTTAETA